MEKIRDHVEVVISIPNDGDCNGCVFCLQASWEGEHWQFECLRFDCILRTRFINNNTKSILAPCNECQNGKYRG